MRRIPVLAAGSLVSAGAIVAVLGIGSGTSYAVTTPSPAVVLDLTGANVRFVPATADHPQVKPDQAVAEARRQFGAAHVAGIYLGRVTKTDYRSRAHALLVDGRLAYLVRFDGLNERPAGVRGQVPAAALHHELVVAIDAATGQFVFATTVR